VRGDTTSYSIAIDALNGFAGAVALSVQGLPNGVSATFLPSTATSSSTLLVSTSRTTPTGTQTLTISGVSGLLTHTTTVTLLVR